MRRLTPIFLRSCAIFLLTLLAFVAALHVVVSFDVSRHSAIVSMPFFFPAAIFILGMIFIGRKGERLIIIATSVLLFLILSIVLAMFNPARASSFDSRIKETSAGMGISVVK